MWLFTTALKPFSGTQDFGDLELCSGREEISQQLIAAEPFETYCSLK